MTELIDTNIIFYSLDNREPEKHETAKRIMKNAFTAGGVVSTQNIAEFFHQSKRKFSVINLESARDLALAIISSEKIVKISYDQDTIYKTINNCKKEQDFWDLVIYYTMLENGITRIITENTDDFKTLNGVVAINPFK